MELTWIETDEAVDWEELSELYRIAPLGDKQPELLKKAFGNSLFKLFIYSSSQLVGVGRALADGVDCSYIGDVAVHPDFQGEGIGKKIITRLVELSQGHRKIILYASPGKETFYAKMGFRKMKTAMAIFGNEKLALEWGLVE